MVPSQDVDAQYQGWRLEGLVEGPIECLSASFPVARLAELPEGNACRGQLSLSFTIIMFWMLALFGRRCGMDALKEAV